MGIGLINCSYCLTFIPIEWSFCRHCQTPTGRPELEIQEPPREPGPYCSQCGKSITKARLDALPKTFICSICAAKAPDVPRRHITGNWF